MVTTQLYSLLEESVPADGLLIEVERIIQGDTLRNSEVLRRLLKYLTEKTISGEADHLKEYTVAIEALEKPQAYDPKHDSTVRIQMGRLRRKLEEYYRTEGKDDQIIIEIPRRRFKLTCVRCAPIAESVSAPSKVRMTSQFIWVVGLICVSLMITAAWIGYSLGHNKRTETPKPADDGTWSADLDQLWRPFLASNRPLILAVGDPPFLVLHPSSLYIRAPYREGTRELNDEINLALVSAIQKVQGDTSVQSSHYYAPFGALEACFLIGRSLAGRVRNISVIRKSELSSDQLADNNVVILTKDFRSQAPFQGMPVRLQLQADSGGIHNLHPKPGEPEEFSNDLGPYSDSGDDYALVSHLPGPLGIGHVEVFTSRSVFGYLGAVQWFTNSVFAHTLVSKLRKDNGEIPRYYQVLLRVRFKDQVPIETTFVLSRELQ